MQTQIDVWIAGLETDEEQLFAKVDSNFFTLEEAEEVFEALNKSMQTTSCGVSWKSVMKHFLLLPSNPFQRMRYMFIIDKVIQQIVIQRDGEDPDPSAALAELDFRSIVNELMDADRIRVEEEKMRKQMEKTRKLEKDIIVLKAELDKERTKVTAAPEDLKFLKTTIDDAKRDVKRLEAFLNETGSVNEKVTEIFGFIYNCLVHDKSMQKPTLIEDGPNTTSAQAPPGLHVVNFSSSPASWFCWFFTA